MDLYPASRWAGLEPRPNGCPSLLSCLVVIAPDIIRRQNEAFSSAHALSAESPTEIRPATLRSHAEARADISL